ncbi:MAG: sporulation protein YabP [Candidatus Carbobacillus altaicus]|nr:sporulation protein YabP [Candidatus Carbobacillus altaicus]
MTEKTIRQEIGLVNRRTLAISGVSQVDSFDSEQFLLETSEGFLLIKGENLHLKQLDLESGEVAIEGKITTLTYLDEGAGKTRKGFFGKLFR